jgi:hypothetical protein
MSGSRRLARSPWFGDGKTSATTEESAANGVEEALPETSVGVERDFEPGDLAPDVEPEIDLERDIEEDLQAPSRFRRGCTENIKQSRTHRFRSAPAVRSAPRTRAPLQHFLKFTDH